MTFFNAQSLKNAYERFYEPESQRRIANAYWPVLLSVACVLALLSVAYGIWQFAIPVEIAGSDILVRAAQADFSKEDLLRIVERLEKRKETFEALITGIETRAADR